MEIPDSIAKKVIDTFHEWTNTEYYTIRVIGKDRTSWGHQHGIEIIVGHAWDCGSGCCSDTE